MFNYKYSGPCLYRGKRLDNGEWVNGNVLKDKNRAFITEGNEIRLSFIRNQGHCNGLRTSSGEPITTIDFEIHPETLSGWTGLEDKNGVKIFTGDVITFNNKVHNDKTVLGALGSGLNNKVFNRSELYKQIIFYGVVEFIKQEFSANGFYLGSRDTYNIKIIGNVFDNPELLESEDEN
jgi:uncharacterized phage protein (TIGR01671 family)